PNIEMLWQNIGLYLIYNRSALLINLHLDDRNVDMKVLRVFVGVRKPSKYEHRTPSKTVIIQQITA
ncbi:MAG: hypothetical protein KIG93_10745, partial [Prevotella sp.]|nr:hypothetical protein [Prevotella sp.]